jgi:hypothetical protein
LIGIAAKPSTPITPLAARTSGDNFPCSLKNQSLIHQRCLRVNFAFRPPLLYPPGLD